ncbi:hypothetical protein ACHAXM_007102 [Skeletonema potamos]
MSVSVETQKTYAARCSFPPRLALAKAALFACPFPSSSFDGSVPITPTQLTTESGVPTTASSSSSLKESKSALFHTTCFVHSSSLHHLGAAPDLEMLDTIAPFSTKILQTLDPVKPVPPKTVIDSDKP